MLQTATVVGTGTPMVTDDLYGDSGEWLTSLLSEGRRGRGT